jgi:cobalt-zinc-cadmium efflux system outer membrane protein
VSAFAVAAAGVVSLTCIAGEPAAFEQDAPPALSREAAMVWGLQRNPELATLRQQHGIAAAAIVIANTYPHNPTWEARIQYAQGPAAAGVLNEAPTEHIITTPVELHGQRTFRRQGAAAALSRTDWEIADQELALAIHVIRAFDTVLFRRERLRLLEETLRLNEQGAERVAQLVEAGRLRGADLIVARSEANDTRAAFISERTTVFGAEADLRRALGVVGENVELQGALSARVPTWESPQLLQSAFERRPDFFAQQAAVKEAEANVRLAVADRFGNPAIGPAYVLDNTMIHNIGGQFNFPVPIFNRNRGEILRRQAERIQAILRVRQTETAIRQDVQAAVIRVGSARATVDAYANQVLPQLEASLRDITNLFERADPGTDLLRVIDIRRKMLLAREGYLTALWELSQARADLAAAVGDPALALVPDS